MLAWSIRVGGRTYIVAVWVLDEGKRIISNLVNELDALMIRRVINAALQDAASVAVSRDLDTVSSYSIINELYTTITCSVKMAEDD
jgi:hypothetical protein